MADRDIEKRLAVYEDTFDVAARAKPTVLDVEAYLVDVIGRLGIGPTVAGWRRLRCRCKSADECDCRDCNLVPIVVNSAAVGSNCAYVLDMRLSSPMGSGKHLDKMALYVSRVNESEAEIPLFDLTKRKIVTFGSPTLAFRVLDVCLLDRMLTVRFDYMSFEEPAGRQK